MYSSLSSDMQNDSDEHRERRSASKKTQINLVGERVDKSRSLGSIRRACVCIAPVRDLLLDRKSMSPPPPRFFAIVIAVPLPLLHQGPEAQTSNKRETKRAMGLALELRRKRQGWVT